MNYLETAGPSSSNPSSPSGTGMNSMANMADLARNMANKMSSANNMANSMANMANMAANMLGGMGGGMGGGMTPPNPNSVSPGLSKCQLVVTSAYIVLVYVNFAYILANKCHNFLSDRSQFYLLLRVS